MDQMWVQASGQGRVVLYDRQWLMPTAVVGAEPRASGITEILGVAQSKEYKVAGHRAQQPHSDR